ncbi:hypothetical protein HMI56_007536 [Coelomomyces lativittatus]|nr:hypothetical protein HMI56_007536 [Coelomomyces lativittatus]
MTETIPISVVISILSSYTTASQPARRIYYFLTFLSSKTKIIEQTLWDIYDDESFIQTSFLRPIQLRVQSLQVYVGKLQRYLTQGALKKKPPPSKPVTIPNPPVLTRLQPPKVHYPIPITKLPKVTPFSIAKSLCLPLHTGSHSNALKKKHAHVHVHPPQEIQEKPPSSSPISNKEDPPQSYSPEVTRFNKKVLLKPKLAPKSTTATVLREHAVIQKREEEAKQQLELSLQSLVDPHVVEEQWLKHQQTEKMEREVHLAQTKLKVLLSHEEAQIAKEAKLKEKSEEAQHLKLQKLEWQEALMKQQAEEQVWHQHLIETVQKGHDRCEEVTAALRQQNQAIVQELQMHQAALYQAWKDQGTAMLSAKKEGIQQLKALKEATSCLPKDSTWDPTTPACLGLLKEMAWEEVLQRLAQVKHDRYQWQVEKHLEIESLKREQWDRVVKLAESVERDRAKRGHSMKDKKGESPSTFMEAATTSGLEKDAKLKAMEAELAKRKLVKQKLIQSNQASPHRYRVRIRHIPEPPHVDPPPSISSSLPVLLSSSSSSKRWTQVSTVPSSLGKKGEVQSLPTLLTRKKRMESTDFNKGNEKDEIEPQTHWQNALQTVLGIDKMVV